VTEKKRKVFLCPVCDAQLRAVQSLRYYDHVQYICTECPPNLDALLSGDCDEEETDGLVGG
jgi:hypothetical protein